MQCNVLTSGKCCEIPGSTSFSPAYYVFTPPHTPQSPQIDSRILSSCSRPRRQRHDRGTHYLAIVEELSSFASTLLPTPPQSTFYLASPPIYSLTEFLVSLHELRESAMRR
ncbi:hypothetical protein BV25DRAFT_1289321 [Artomyces pyxidatus]|uniref:Uncharacterized protein n=1 Tax=Artomyces pyxidatus TaxID=48021 RepID=A0ACB8SR45_9AGAM|nr:hypothetical protein BV25DRAFT_1289321 [Artomyces pyxidatus]